MRNVDGLLVFWAGAAGVSLVCFVVSGSAAGIAVWCGVGVASMLAIYWVSNRSPAPAPVDAAPTAGQRHHGYVFASQTPQSSRRRRVVVD